MSDRRSEFCQKTIYLQFVCMFMCLYQFPDSANAGREIDKNQDEKIGQINLLRGLAQNKRQSSVPRRNVYMKGCRQQTGVQTGIDRALRRGWVFSR